MPRTFKVVLNKSSESRHLCLILDLSGNAFSLSLLSMFIYGLDYVEVGSLYAHFLESIFYHK